MGKYKEFSFKFVPGVVNGRPAHLVQVWLTDATFSVMEQGWFDNVAFRFKFKTWPDIPVGLAKAIQYAYVATFQPVKKDFREAAEPSQFPKEIANTGYGNYRVITLEVAAGKIETRVYCGSLVVEVATTGQLNHSLCFERVRSGYYEKFGNVPAFPMISKVAP